MGTTNSAKWSTFVHRGMCFHASKFGRDKTNDLIAKMMLFTDVISSKPDIWVIAKNSKMNFELPRTVRFKVVQNG